MLNGIRKIYCYFNSFRDSSGVFDNIQPQKTGETYPGTIDDGIGKSLSYETVFYTESEYKKSMRGSNDDYLDSAGCDLSNIFCPYEVISENVDLPNASSMPKIQDVSNSAVSEGVIDFKALIPYPIDSTNQNTHLFEDKDLEGSFPDVVTGEFYTRSTNTIRNRSNYRSVGLRGPVIISGWGFDIDDIAVPYPEDSEGERVFDSDPAGFKGGDNEEVVDFGHQVNPKHYYTGPLDVRWDNERKVWSASGSSRPEVWAKIVSSSETSINRWTYTLRKQKHMQNGTFVDETEEITYTAWNTIEANNDGTAIEGSGDDMSDIPPGSDLSLMPIGVGAVVRLKQYTNCDGNAEWLFEAPNNIGGTC